MNHTVPAGFRPFRADGTFNDTLAPIYLHADGPWPVLGMRVCPQHTNFAGHAHGGCLMTFLDIALSGAVCSAIGHYDVTPTITLSVDFMAPARLGDWLQADILSVDLTRSLGFVNAVVSGPQGRVARASGCFKRTPPGQATGGMPAREYHQWRTSPA